MARVGTLTFHKTPNYGAVLQAYALPAFLRSLGHEAEVIDFQMPPVLSEAGSPMRKCARALNQAAAGSLGAVQRKASTERFLQTHIPLSKECYATSAQLRANPPSYDAYISGSDQIWNPRSTARTHAYFLDFVPPDKRRIAYAASVGVDQISESDKSSLGENLARLHFISVREEALAELIGELTGQIPPVVLDPTLLLDAEKWCQLGTRVVARPHILCYHMPGDAAVQRHIASVARKLRERTGLPIVNIGQRAVGVLQLPGRSVYTAGPSEFLSLVQSASFILTNSFHGTAFAVNFGTPFLVVHNKAVAPHLSRSDRLHTLLASTGLLAHLRDAGSNIAESIEIAESGTDRKEVQKHLEGLRSRSVGFLKDALK